MNVWCLSACAATLLVIQCYCQVCKDHGRFTVSCSKETWRRDSFCYRESCKSTLQTTFKFRIEMRYPGRNVPVAARQRGMFIVGEGAGLSWKRKRKLTKKGESLWSIGLSYVAGTKAFFCRQSTMCERNQQYVEFRLYRGNTEMLGPNFRINLPLSSSLRPKNDRLVPFVQVYPWFDRRSMTKAKLRNYDINGVGRRSFSLYLPASFAENTYKTYPTLLVYGKNTIRPLLATISDLTSKRGLMEEIILVGVPIAADHDIIPRKSPILQCKKRSRKGDRTCGHCIKCFSEEFVEPCDSVDFAMEFKKCVTKRLIRGRGMLYLQGILKVVLPKIAKAYGNRPKIGEGSLGIMGHGLSGMMACYAAFKMPRRFNTVICMSPRFGWPDADPNNRHTLELLKRSSALLSSSRLRVYIDASENDDWRYSIASVFKSATEAVNLLRKRHGFVQNKDLFYYPLYNEHKKGIRRDSLSLDVILARCWIPLTIMYAPPSGARRSIKVASCLKGESKSPRRTSPDQSKDTAVQAVEEDLPCPSGVSLPVLIGSILGTFTGTLLITMLFAFLCQSSSAHLADV